MSDRQQSWLQKSPPAPASLSFGAEAPSSSFQSSLDAFNLRSRNTVPGFGQGGSAPIPLEPQPSLETYPLFSRVAGSPTGPGMAAGPSAASFANRKPSTSMLASEPLYPPRNNTPSPPCDEEEPPTAMSRDGTDSPMVVGSPTFEAAGLSFPPPASFGGRSRTHSESKGSNHGTPASPVALARALQGQRTPPPFLQRRLYNEMQEDDSMSAPRSGSASSSGGARADDESVDDNGALGLALGEKMHGHGGSGSASGSGEEGSRVGVVRRAVSRKPNLLPKSKSHLRVLSQLQSESGPADLAEVMSEAALHRLSMASSVPPVRSTPLSSSGTSACLPTRAAPLGNRFPEQVNEDDMDRIPSPASSLDEGDEMEAGSDWGGMSLGGYGTDNEDERQSAIWTGIRGSGSATGISIPPANGPGTGRSPGSERGKMEVEAPNNSPQTPSWAQPSARPGKRKMNDETSRFEPYASAFKRRAVSPAALSPGGLASPLLSFTHSSTLPTPPPLPAFPSSISTLPISIPSPSMPTPASHSHANFFNTLNQGPRSRAASPVPSSLSSSAGRGAAGQAFVGMVMSGRLEREERSLQMGDTGDTLRNMSLG